MADTPADITNVYDKLLHPLALGLFLLTLILPVLVGLLSMRRTQNQSDFFVGGGAMNRFVVALSAVSSGRSSWLVLGVSGMAYKMGIGAVFAILGYIAVEALQFVYVGKRLRKMTGQTGAITLMDFFADRFGDSNKMLRIIGSAIIVLFTTAYVAAQFNAGAKTITSALHLPFGVSLVAAGILVIAYMLLGGFVAVAWNDVVRACIMIFGLVVLPVAVFFRLGGLAAFWHGLPDTHTTLLSVGGGAIVGFLAIGLGSPGQPHIVVRYMSIKDARQLSSAAIIGTVWNVILGLGAVAIGLLGKAMIPDVSQLPGNDPEMVYLVLSDAQFGPLLYGLLVGGIFAAILSTADSQLLVVASTLVRDLYEKVFCKSTLRDDRRLALSRKILAIAGCAAILLAWLADDLVFWLVLFAWGGLGASLGPALILSLYWKRVRPEGVITGMIAGTLVTIVWKLFLKSVTGIYELIPAFLCATLSIVVVSLLYSRTSKTAQNDRANTPLGRLQ